MRKDLFSQVERAAKPVVRPSPPPSALPLDCRGGVMSSAQTWQFLEDLRRMAAESLSR